MPCQPCRTLPKIRLSISSICLFSGAFRWSVSGVRLTGSAGGRLIHIRRCADGLSCFLRLAGEKHDRPDLADYSK